MQAQESKPKRRNQAVSSPAADLAADLESRLIGQNAAIEAIVPYVHTYQAGLSPEGRPVGVFMLLGPTGTGKTKTVEALAGALHGSEKHLLRVDCGEFQMEHEVAKLIGAPPGYLGHRETTPMLNQAKLISVTSDQCSLSILLLDEIEKAAPSMSRLLLGVLDKATLRLGDNSSVNFERTIIFMTSNLGGKSINRALKPDFGFEAMLPVVHKPKLGAIALAAAKKNFTAEFMNRVDAVVTYQPLDRESLWTILNQHLAALNAMVDSRLDGGRAFDIEVSRESRLWLLAKGTSVEYGARELKRTIQRSVIHPMASMVVAGLIPPGSRLDIVLAQSGEELEFQVS